MNPDRAVVLLKNADPATGLESIELPYASGAAYLAALEQGSGTMKTHEEVRELPGIDTPAKQPGGRWRGPLIAAAAAVVALIVVGVGLLLFTDGSDPAPVVDEPVPTTTATEGFGRDPVLVGNALTAAYNSADGSSYLALFAADARLVANGYETSLDELRTAFEVWDLPMAQRLEWTDCELRSDAPFGARVECAVTITSDWLAPVLEPIDAVASIVVSDGEITQYTITEQAGAHDATLRRYRDWTFANHPDQAPLMWRTERSHPEVALSTESTELHTRLGALYLQQLNAAAVASEFPIIAALESTQNAYDGDAYRDLFAETASISFNGQPGTVDDLGDFAWAQAMNWQIRFTECGSIASEIFCAAEITSDWLDPILEPIPVNITLALREDRIGTYRLADQDGAHVSTLAAFKAWTLRTHPDEAAQMWVPNNAFPVQVFSEDSAELHLQLGLEYVAEVGSSG